MADALGAALGTTAYAILGLLAVHEGTAYDIAKRAATNYRFFWPRAESKLYEEVKRLVDAGLVLAKEGATGKRKRTLYRINAAGLRALAAWVQTPAAMPKLEFEALVKLTYADFAGRDTIVSHLAAIAAHARGLLAFGEALGRRYAAGEVELPQRAHMNVLVWRFMHAQYGALAAWAEWAAGEVACWPDDVRASAVADEVLTWARAAFAEALTPAAPAPPVAPAAPALTTSARASRPRRSRAAR